MTESMSNKTTNGIRAGFTFVEIIVVMAIISAMVAMVLPMASRSSDMLKAREYGRNVAEIYRYGISMTQGGNKKVKLEIDPQGKSYQIFQEADEDIYEPIDNYFGALNKLDGDVVIRNFEGMVREENKCHLIIDPQEKLPEASFEIITEGLVQKIIIAGREVKIEDESI